MSSLMRFPSAVKRHNAVQSWLREQPGELGVLARHWLEVIRRCGEEYRELLHDGYATACVHDAAFAYIGVFKSHVNVGFFRGAELTDPSRLLEGTGKLMRHVKLRPGRELDEAALTGLITLAYTEMRSRMLADEIEPPPGLSEH